MTRKRRCNRSAQPNRLDQSVVMFGFIQDSKDWKEWFYRSLSLRLALRMIADGEAEAMQQRTANGLVTFYRELKPIGGETYASPATLTFATMNAVANNEAISQLTHAEKQHIAKFVMWPFIGDTKAVAVRPRVTDRERIQASSMMNRARGVRASTAGHCHRSRGGEVRTMHFETQSMAAAA